MSASQLAAMSALTSVGDTMSATTWHAASRYIGISMELAAGETHLAFGGLVRFHPNWMDLPKADDLLGELRASVGWSQGTIVLFGREVQEPRLTAWYGDVDYTYSGRTMKAAPWPPVLATLRSRVQAAVSVPLNTVLLNLYRDGKDSMGMHSDDEPELGRDPIIASVSLGAPRKFVLEPKRKSARRNGSYALVLSHGSLLVMAGSCQHHYRHGVPKEAKCRGERINLTFRHVLVQPSGP